MWVLKVYSLQICWSSDWASKYSARMFPPDDSTFIPIAFPIFHHLWSRPQRTKVGSVRLFLKFEMLCRFAWHSGRGTRLSFSAFQVDAVFCACVLHSHSSRIISCLSFAVWFIPLSIIPQRRIILVVNDKLSSFLYCWVIYHYLGHIFFLAIYSPISMSWGLWLAVKMVL